MPRNATKYRKPTDVETIEALIVPSEYGTPQPQLRYTGATAMHHRLVSARLHELAALVEIALASTTERWPLHIERDSDYHGRVVIEVDDIDEARRGLALLGRIIDEMVAERRRSTTIFCEYEDCTLDATERRGGLALCAGHAEDYDRDHVSGPCAFDECECAATELSGGLPLCAQHAAEHEELLAEQAAEAARARDEAARESAEDRRVEAGLERWRGCDGDDD